MANYKAMSELMDMKSSKHFPHGATMRKLTAPDDIIRLLGVDGYGRFMILLELLMNNENNLIDYTQLNIETLLKELKFSKLEELESFLLLLEKQNAIKYRTVKKVCTIKQLSSPFLSYLLKRKSAFERHGQLSPAMGAETEDPQGIESK